MRATVLSLLLLVVAGLTASAEEERYRIERQEGGYARIAGFDILELMPGGALLGGINGVARKLFRRDPDMPSLFGVMMASLNIILDRMGRTRLAAEPPDVAIDPRLGHIGAAEFDRAAELIDLGYAAAEAAIPDIREALRVTSYGLDP